MTNALEKYRKALKRYRKENPSVPFKTAQKRVSEMMHKGEVSGTTKRKKKPSSSHKTAIRTVGRTQTRSTGKRASTRKKVAGKTIGRIGRAESLISQINRLETKRERLENKELRDIVQLEINACHDKLDALKRTFKRKSA